jgi:hypothetical protein
MNAKEAVSLLAVVVLALLAMQVSFDESDAKGDLDGVLISEFSPYDWEGVTLKNYSSKSVDLKGYYLSDGEDECKFTKSLVLDSKESITIVRPDSSAKTAFADRDNVIHIGNSGVEAGENYVFSNKGDEVFLYSPSGNCIDAICFGSKTISDSRYWSGSSVTINGTNAYVGRMGSTDTDTAADWGIAKPGRTSYAFDPSLAYSATVTPFVFPDSGGVPIFDAISGAKKSVHIEIYQLTNANMYALLCNLVKKGVEVVVLMEASPNGGDQSDMASRMKALVNAGGEVKLIGGQSGERFSFVHAKYAIVDGTKTIVTSENWTADNLNGSIHNGTYSGEYGNRGWGAVIESKEYGSFMESVFQNDLDDSYGDVRDFSEMSYANASAATMTYKPVSSGSFPSYSAKVCPMLSPDNSWDTEMYWISNASERAYVQQQNVGDSYLDYTESSSPLYVLNAAATSGVDARIMVTSGGSYAAAANSLVDRLNSGSAIKAAAMDTPYIHNKGLVCDDRAIVSSVNWTSNSFNNNREVGAVILSSEVADYFASVFERDFSRNYEYEGLSVNILTTQKSYDLGEKVTFEVEVRPAGSYTYEWSFGDGQTATTKVPYASVTPKAGAHVLEVTVKDSSGQIARATMDYAVVDLRVTLTASASKITLGDSIKFEADVDPSGSYTYKWTFDDGYSKTTSSPSFTYTPTKAGSNGVILVVTDGSNTGLADVDFNVVSGSGSGDSSSEGGLGSMIYAIIAAVIAAIVAIIGLAKKVLK